MLSYFTLFESRAFDSRKSNTNCALFCSPQWLLSQHPVPFGPETFLFGFTPENATSVFPFIYFLRLVFMVISKFLFCCTVSYPVSLPLLPQELWALFDFICKGRLLGSRAEFKELVGDRIARVCRLTGAPFCLTGIWGGGPFRTVPIAKALQLGNH